jgi:hypothetical protein
MPGPSTPLLGLTVPTVGGDINAWGAELNADLALLDALGAAQVLIISSNTIVALTQPVTIILAISGGTGVTITLPNPSFNKGRMVWVKKTDTGVGPVTLVPASGQIEGGNNYQLVNRLQSVILAPDAVNWWAFAGQ